MLLTEDLSADEGPGVWAGHAAHQDPDADGTTTVDRRARRRRRRRDRAARVIGTEGVDLVARAPTWPPSRPSRA